MNRKRNVPAPIGGLKMILIGVCAMYAIMILGALILAWLVSNEKLSTEASTGLLSAVLALSAMIGAILGIKAANLPVAITAAIYCAISFLVMPVAHMLFGNGLSSNIWHKGLLLMVGTGAAAAFCIRKRKKLPYKKNRFC